MRTLVEFRLEDGGTLVAEVENGGAPASVPQREVTRGLRSGELVQKADATLEAAFARVRPAATAIVRTLHELEDAPDEIDVEFGIQLRADVGAIVAHSSAEANFRVALLWRRESKAAAPGA
jgi:hypothetical protein